MSYTQLKDFTYQEVLEKLSRRKRNFYVTLRWHRRCLITVRNFERKIQFLNENFIIKF